MSNRTLELGFWLGAGAGVVCLLCVVVVAFQSAGSRNLALALGTLIGAFLLFATQLYFELRSQTRSEGFATEFMLDKQAPHLAQRAYGLGQRGSFEVAASDQLANDNPKEFEIGAPILSRDMTIASYLMFLFAEQFDWQVRTDSYRDSMGTMTIMMLLSDKADCRMIKASEVRDLLKAAGNRFWDAPIWHFERSICLPPHSTLEITSSAVTIHTRFCDVTFAYERYLGGRAYRR